MGLMCIGLMPGLGRADIIFTQSSVETTTNIGSFVIGPDGSAIGQELGGNGSGLLRVTTNSALDIQGQGQAFLIAADPSKPFTTVTITPADGGDGFSIVEFNPQFGNPKNQGGGSAGTFMLTAAYYQNGLLLSSGPLAFDLTKGENRVAAVATDGEVITKLTFETLGETSVGTLRQFRVSIAEGASGGPTFGEGDSGGPVPNPEPSTIVMALTGLIPIGLAGLRRVRRRPVVA